MQMEVNDVLTLNETNHTHGPFTNGSTSIITKTNDAVLKSVDLSHVEVEKVNDGHVYQNRPHSHHHGHSHDLSSVRSIAYTLILGDGLHRIFDGVAVGAAFATSISGGISTSIAVLCHELPHELGDFVVLLRAGMKMKAAIFYNVLVGLLSAVGAVIGYLSGGMEAFSSWLFMLIGGLFIYIALVDMIPELSTTQLKGNPKLHRPWIVFLGQNIGILLGYTIMLVIALYEGEMLRII